MPNISLQTFLKIASKSTPQKYAEYAKYLTPGGYDFYWTLKSLATQHTVGAKSADDCLASFKDIKREVERKHNTEAFLSLQKWLQDKKDQTFFSVAKGRLSSAKGFLTIKVEPEFGIANGSDRRLILLWPSQGSELNHNTAGIGMAVMKQVLLVDTFCDCKPAILNLRNRNLFAVDVLHARFSTMLAAEIAFADSFFEEMAKAA